MTARLNNLFVSNNTGQWLRKAVLAGTAMALTGALASSPALAADLPGKGVTVQPLKSSIAEEAFQTLLVTKALEKLGYSVQPVKEVE